MKYIILLFTTLLTLHASEKKLDITLGAGVYFQTQPYKGVNTQVLPSPVIFFDNELFYMRWSRIGVYFLGQKNDDLAWVFSLTMQPRVFGYKDSDIQGMNERENSWEGGLAFSMQKDAISMEIMLLQDLLNKYDSWILKAEITYDFKVANFSIYPSVIALYQAKDFVNYYYGITKGEATLRGETEYRADAGLQLGIQTYIKYPITKQLSSLINLRADRLPSSAYSSAIVEDKYIYSGLASLIYTFQY